jgi:titin
VSNFKPITYNEELTKCKRFYQKVDAVLKAGTGAGNSSRKFGINLPLSVAPRSANAKVSISQNNNNLIDSFTATITENAYLNLIADTKNLYSELNLQLIIDDEIPLIKEPGVITSTSIIRGSGKVDLDWNAPSNTDTTINYAVLYGNTPNNITNIATFGDSSGSITGLTDSSPYYFKLYSINSYGPSLLSNIFEVAPAYYVPSGLTSLTGVWGFDTTQLSWDGPNNNGGSPVTGYRIDRSMYSNFPDVQNVPNFNSTFYVSDSTRNFSISKFSSELTSTGNYYFRVAAMNLAGTGTPSSFTLSKTTPSAPTGLSSLVGDAAVTLNYLPPSSNGGLIIDHVSVEKSLSSSFASTTGSLHVANYQPITLTGLTPNVTHYFRIRAHNASGYGPYSSTVSAMPNKPITVPNPPQSISASWVDDDTVQVLMSAPTDDGGTPIINYTVYSSSGSGFAINLTTSITQNSIPNISFDVPITGNYNTFYFRGKANNSIGSSLNSPTGSLAKQSPNAPTITNLFPGDASIIVSYTKPISRGSAITGYLIDYSINSNFSSSTTTTSTSLSKIITGLTNNTPYYIRVRAANIIGTGSYSNTSITVPASPYSAPTAPADLNIGELNYGSASNSLPVNTSSFHNRNVYAGWIYSVIINNSYQTANFNVSDSFTPGGVTFTGQVYGSNPYFQYSDFRRAAVHAGVFSSLSSTGVLYIYGGPIINPLYGSTRNSFTSENLINTLLSQNTFSIIGASTNTGCYYTKGDVNGITTNTHSPILTWSGPSNNGGLPITGYEIQYAANSSFSSQLTTLFVPGRFNYHTQCISHSGVDLYARIRAYNATGVSPWSNTATRLGKGLGAPQPPTSVTATAIGTTGISLSWTAPSNPIGSGFDSPSNITYRLQYWNQATSTIQTAINYSGVTSAIIPINGPATYTLQLQTKNSIYFSNSNNTVLTVSSTKNTTPTTWVFSTSTPCCGAASSGILVSKLNDNINQVGSTFSSCAGANGLAFITADFGSIKNITNIFIRPHHVYGPYYLNHALLEGSTDGISWTTIVNFANFTTIPVFKDATTQVPINSNLNYRYIRLKSGNISCIDLSEFKFS